MSGPRFPALVGLMLTSPRRGLERVEEEGGGVNAAAWLVLLGALCFRLGDLVEALLGISSLPLQSVLVQLLVVARHEVFGGPLTLPPTSGAPLPTILVLGFLLFATAGRGRRDSARDFDLAAACWIPSFAARAVYRASSGFGLSTGADRALERATSWLGLACTLIVFALAWRLARRRSARAAASAASSPVAAPAASSEGAQPKAPRATRVASLGVALALGLGFFHSSRFVADNLQRLQPLGPGAAAPDFSLPRVEDPSRLVSLSGLQGRVVLLDFWATWCPPCIEMLPTLHELYGEWQGRGVEFVGINEDGPGSEALVRRFLGQHSIPYPVVLDDESASERYKVTALPRLVLVDRSGAIVKTFVGSVSKRALASALAGAIDRR